MLNDEGSHKTMYRKKDGASDVQDNRRFSNEALRNDTISEDSLGLPDEVRQALLLYRRPVEAALNQQALLARAISDDKAFNAPTIGSLANSITDGLMDSCLQSPFLACYTVWLGRKRQDPRLIDASREFYVHALKDTHTALVTPDTAYTDAALAACNALGIYEALECPGGTMVSLTGWRRVSHLRLYRTIVCDTC